MTEEKCGARFTYEFTEGLSATFGQLSLTCFLSKGHRESMHMSGVMRGLSDGQKAESWLIWRVEET